MDNSIIVALITGGAAVIGQYLITRANANKEKIEQGKRDQHLDDQLDQLKLRVDEHNNYAKLFSQITTDIKLIAQDVRYLKEGKFHDNSNAKSV